MTPLKQLYHDTLSTAIEGGIAYWAEILSVAQDAEDNYLSAKICDHEDNSAEHLVTVDTIELGIGRIMSDANPVASRYNTSIRSALDDPENSGVWIDADVADVIVQVGLFGKAVYN